MMPRSIVIITVVLASLVLMSFDAAVAANTKKKQLSSSVAAEKKTDGKRTATGWTKISTNKPDLCEVSYKVDGGAITLKVKNLRSDKPVRVVYSVQCQAQNKNGKWEPYQTYPPEGLRMTVKKQDEIEKNIWTNGNSVKNVAFTLSVSDAE